MLIAAIDNSLDLLNVIVADDEKILAERNIKSLQTPSEIIATTLSGVLADAGRAIADIKAIFVTLGPGSFTGIRVSLAFCKGYRSAKNIPLIGVPTLDVLAQPCRTWMVISFAPSLTQKSEVFFRSITPQRKG